MSPPPFKVGDTVKCVDPRSFPDGRTALVRGREYIITAIDDQYGQWYVSVWEGRHAQTYTHRFVLSTPDGCWRDGFGITHKDATDV